MKDTITAVIIGLNESENLKEAISSVKDSGIGKVLYVDSGSTDHSVHIAECNGAHTVVIDNSLRSPGYARNVGVDRVNTPFVLLMDGDMILDDEFVEHALPLLEDEKVACVTGPINERFPRKNIYHRAISVHWLFPQKGESITPAGGGLFRTEYFKHIKGYNPEIPAGEEIELRNKILQQGYVVKSVDTYFAEHDLGMEGLGDLIRRAMREGRLQGYALKDKNNSAIANYKRLAVKNCILMFILLMLIFVAVFQFSFFIFFNLVFFFFIIVFLKNFQMIMRHQDPVAIGLSILLSYLKIPIQVYALIKYVFLK